MFIEFRVRTPSGSIVDVVARVPRSAMVSALTDALIRQLSAVDPLLGSATADDMCLRRADSADVLDPEREVASSGLHRGDLVELIARPVASAGRHVDVDRSPTLTVIEGPDAGNSYALTPGAHRIGRSRDCVIRLSDPTVSRQQCELQVDESMVITASSRL